VPVWDFPPADAADEDGLVGVGADLEPETLLAAYRSGLFPMPLPARSGPPLLAWWSPDPRGILPLDALVMSRSLRRSCRRFEVRVDTAFEAVVEACAEPAREGMWITAEMARAYRRLHRQGWAHSVECWDEDGTLAGGLYGVAIGGLFAGESMFHHQRDASKVALVALVEYLRQDPGGGLLDVQWTTSHLVSLGAVDIERAHYLALLVQALGQPLPKVFSSGPCCGQEPRS